MNTNLIAVVVGFALAALSQLWVAGSIKNLEATGMNIWAALLGVAGIAIAIRYGLKLHRQHRNHR